MTLILTLQIDEAGQTFYEGLRRRYFPPERNLIGAHVTLFHQLADEERTYEVVSASAQGMSSFRLMNPTARSIGRGVAVFFESERLSALHAELAAAFEAHVTPQDRQRFRPHITVQNKVEPEVARATLALLGEGSVVEAEAVGLTLWRYLGGPWERVRGYPFGESQATDQSRSEP